MAKNYWFLVFSLFLCSSCQNTTNSSSLESNVFSSNPTYQTKWPDDVQSIIEESCHGFSIPFFEAEYYEASLESSDSGTFAIIYCYRFDERNAVKNYNSILENDGYEIEDLTYDYGCYYAQKSISTVSTSIIQYNYVIDPIDNYFMIATTVTGTTQSTNQTTQWPKEEIEAILNTDLPHYVADYYLYAPYVTGDGSLGIILNCYGENVSQNSEEEYKNILIEAGFEVSVSGNTYFGSKDNLCILFYYSQYEMEEAYFVIYAYYKQVSSSIWPSEQIYQETGLVLPIYQQEGIEIESQLVTQEGSTYYCIWIWGANDTALETYHQQLLNDGWVIDSSGSIENGYVYQDESGQHRIQSIYYPKELTYELQDCLFLMIQ